MINEFRSPTSARRMAGISRSLRLAALVIAGAALAAGCSSDDTDSTGEASSTEVVADDVGGEWATASLDDLKISEARVGEPAGATAGLYLSVTNEGDAPDTLKAINTEISPEVQLHETVTDGDRTSMQELPSGVELPAGETVTLEPGGLHAMLMEVDAIKAGEQVSMTLLFEQAGEVEIDVPVVGLTELGGDHDEMGHDDMDHDEADADHDDGDEGH